MAPPAAADKKQPLTLASLSKLPAPAKVGMGVVLCAIVAGAYWGFFYSEVASKIDGLRRTQKKLTAELEEAKQAQTAYFADREELALRQQRQRELNKVLPAGTEIAGFLSSLQSVASASGVQLLGLQPREEVLEPFFAKQPMSLEISGHYHQIVKFAHEVGKLDRITNLEDIEVIQVTVQGDDITLRVRCLATAFHELKASNP
jgi:type IV pilus assembly protein PilO